MDRTQPNHAATDDFALGMKTAVIVVVLGLIAALADHALVTPSDEPAIAQTAPAAASPAAATRIEVPFTVNAGDVEPPPSTF